MQQNYIHRICSPGRLILKGKSKCLAFCFFFQVLSKDGKEFSLIDEYVKNTHAETHQQYELEILEVRLCSLRFNCIFHTL